MSEPVHPDMRPSLRPWHWRSPRYAEHFRRCSYCGSINPDDLAGELWLPEWADMKYGWPHKFYAEIRNREPWRLFCTSWTDQDWPPMSTARDGWVSVDDLTAQQRTAVEQGGLRQIEAKWYMFSTRKYHQAKFYTTHLADPKLDPDVKAAIEQRSGIRFEFDNGTVTFRAAA